MAAEEYGAIQNALAVTAVGQTSPVSVQELDLQHLVNLRQQHETRQAIEGVRTRSGNFKPSTEVSSRRQLIKEIHEVLKAVDGRRGVGTGLERSVRWTGNAPVISEPSGNAANAKVVADRTAKSVSISIIVVAAAVSYNILSVTIGAGKTKQVICSSQPS